MTLLIDNDIVYKLAQLDLLNNATSLLNDRYGDLEVLNTLRFKFCPVQASKRVRQERKHTAEVINRIEHFIDTAVTEIDCEITDSALLEAMAVSDGGLDVGEMQLLQTMIERDESSMFTGDKRFLKALAQDENVSVHSEKLTESFVCFEQIMIFLIKEFGFDYVKDKFVSALDSGLKVDSTLSMCFQGRELAEESRVFENLELNVASLRRGTLSLLSTLTAWVIPEERVGILSELTVIRE
ncbi:hypothetical protein GNP81_10365 [Aliivibrio fischeri]|uniref:hypothetical protein n=1 Tax=Aliivibrio fischeri TaxID=668 RepID=UPI0012D8709D|nr:hypothetical protein [Aliivibrio fischeri]MUK63240.1 hypothetical protein [Aliivibrio fischeri]MUL20143.1 hypothetical protein [Aliivibrio fischeri]MUL25006.1 hypothetical protein [Aliivibrio fischeri]